jgi:hypothetical protein
LFLIKSFVVNFIHFKQHDGFLIWHRSVLPFASTWNHPGTFVRSVSHIFLVLRCLLVLVFVLASYVQCFLCLCIVQSSLSLRLMSNVSCVSVLSSLHCPFILCPMFPVSLYCPVFIRFNLHFLLFLHCLTRAILAEWLQAVTSYHKPKTVSMD